MIFHIITKDDVNTLIRKGFIKKNKHEVFSFTEKFENFSKIHNSSGFYYRKEIMDCIITKEKTIECVKELQINIINGFKIVNTLAYGHTSIPILLLDTKEYWGKILMPINFKKISI